MMRMLSRIADSLFWLNRYMERTDSLLRLFTVHHILSLDKGTGTAEGSWRNVLETATHSPKIDFSELENDTALTLKMLLLDSTANHNSLKVIIHRARENARGIQDHITKEVWEEVNQMYHYINEPGLQEKLSGNQAMEVLEALSQHAVMFVGITEITMPRGAGWNFMSLGKYIERCFHTIAIMEKQLQLMDYKIDEQGDILQWRYTLLALSGFEQHLKTYTSSHYTNNLLHQVIFNENFTRSIMYSLSRIHIYLQKVMPKGSTSENKAILNCYGRLYSKVRYTELESINAGNLQEFLQGIKSGLAEFSTRFAQHFFSYH